MTRIEAIKARLAAATQTPHGPASQVFVGGSGWTKDVEGLTPQDLRDLLGMWDAIRTVRNVSANNADARIYGVYAVMVPVDAFEGVEKILSRLDSPVGNEGAEK